jgi:hypothetical protein
MNLNLGQLEKLIKKLTNVIKPKGVSDIEFELESIDGNEYYMSIGYILPDDSEFLRSKNMRNSDMIRREWNNEMKKAIKNYFDADVIITSSRISAESYYNRLKDF